MTIVSLGHEFVAAQENNAPLATNNTVITTEDTAVVIAALANAIDVDGDVLTAVSVSQGINGAVTINANGTVTYTTSPNFNGQDSFTNIVTDGGVRSATAAATVIVTAVNDAPVAVAQSVTTAEDTPVQITLTGSDVDGNALTFSLVTGPTDGTLSGTPPAVTYTPNANFHGTDGFTFRVSNSVVASLPGTVTVAVPPVNDAPTATSASIVTNEDNPSSCVTPSVTDVDVTTNGDVHTFAIVSPPSHGVVAIVSGCVALA